MNEEVDLETQLDIIEIGANAIHVELQNVKKITNEIAEKINKLEREINGTPE